MTANQAKFPIETMARVMGVSRSGCLSVAVPSALGESRSGCEAV